MISLVIFIILALAYTSFFFMDRKRSIFFLFLIKLPLDQFSWNISFSILSISLRISEAFVVFITLLTLSVFFLDKPVDPYRRGFIGQIPKELINPVVLFILILLLNIFLNILNVRDLMTSLEKAIRLTTGIIVGTYVAKTLDTDEDINWLVGCMLFSTMIISILSIPAIYFGGEFKVYAPTSYDERLIGTAAAGGVGRYQNATSFADAFITNVPAILLASVVLQARWKKILCLLVTLFCVVAVFVSASRAGWITLSLILVFWMLMQRRWKLIAISAFCVFGIVTAQFFSEPLGRAYQKIAFEKESLEKGELPSNAFSGRPLTWATYMTYYMDAPLIDKLLGNENIIRLGANVIGHDPHNDFIFILLKTGIIGLSITLLLYTLAIIHILRVTLRTDDFYDWNISLTALIAFISMIVPAFARTGLMNPNFEWIFWIFTMLIMKRQNLTTNIEYQDAKDFNADDKSKNILSGENLDN